MVRVLCCVGHSTAVGVDLTGFAAATTGSFAVATGVVLLGA